jgi:hypothetical protein
LFWQSDGPEKKWEKYLNPVFRTRDDGSFFILFFACFSSPRPCVKKKRDAVVVG